MQELLNQLKRTAGKDWEVIVVKGIYKARHIASNELFTGTYERVISSVEAFQAGYKAGLRAERNSQKISL